MKRIGLVLAFALCTTGCATGASFLSSVEEAPKWFTEKIPKAEDAGYPTTASTPPRPADVPALASWDVKLAELKATGEALMAAERAQAGLDGLNSQDFLTNSLHRADVDTFNEEEAAAADAAEAAKKSSLTIKQ